MLEIVIQPEASQVLRCVIGEQQVQIATRQKRQGLFVDIAINGENIVTSVIALNEVPIICREYLGFKGNFYFIDTLGSENPEYSGLGDRFNLIYLEEEEYALVRQ